MKIGIDARMYGAKSTTGIGVYIEQLTNQLFEIDSANQYYLFLRDSAFRDFKPPHSRVVKVRAEIPWYGYQEQLKMPNLLRRYQLDLVHFPHFNVPILYRGKYVVTIHDITPKFFPGPVVKKSIIRKLAYNWVFNHGIKNAQRIIAISKHTKNNLIKYFDVKEDKIEVVYPGLTKSQAVPNQQTSQAVLQKYQITKPFIFYVGVWRNHKNLPALIKAFDIFKKRFGLDYQLVLAGKNDPRYPEIQAAINQAKFKSDIITPGFVTEQELPIFYQAADLFVLPSFCEGFGLVAIEALAYGTPVIGSNTTSLPEVIGAGGKFFDPKDIDQIAIIMKEVIVNDQLAKNLVNQGQKQITKYNWTSAARETLAIYQSDPRQNN